MRSHEGCVEDSEDVRCPLLERPSESEENDELEDHDHDKGSKDTSLWTSLLTGLQSEYLSQITTRCFRFYII